MASLFTTTEAERFGLLKKQAEAVINDDDLMAAIRIMERNDRAVDYFEDMHCPDIIRYITDKSDIIREAQSSIEAAMVALQMRIDRGEQDEI